MSEAVDTVCACLEAVVHQWASHCTLGEPVVAIVGRANRSPWFAPGTFGKTVSRPGRSSARHSM